jgi:hypothetical protein
LKNYVIKINLTDKSTSDFSVSSNLHSCLNEAKKIYLALIDNLNYNNPNNIDWIASNTSSRDPFNSSILKIIQTLLFINKIELNSQSPRIEITTNSLSIQKLFKSIKLNNSQLIVKLSILDFFNKYIFVFLKNVFASAYHAIFQYVCINFFIKYKPVSKNYFFLKTYIYKDSFVNKKFNDKHFPNINNYFSNDIFKKRRYFFSIYGVKNYFSYFLKNSKFMKNCYFKEQFLSFSDYYFAFTSIFRLRNINLKHSKIVLPFNLSLNEVLFQELLLNSTNNSTVEGILLYRIFSNKQCDQNIYLSWFENQPIDRGLFFGLNSRKNKINNYGYIGYYTSYLYMNQYFLKSEIVNSFLPKKILSMCNKELMLNAPDYLRVTPFPSLRYNFRTINNIKNFKNTIIALPVVKDLNINLQKVLVKFFIKYQYSLNKFNFFIKSHPSNNYINRKLIDISKHHLNINFVSNKIDDYYLQSSLLISTASSAPVDALAYGLPSLIMSDHFGYSHVPYPLYRYKNYYKIFYNENELFKLFLIFSKQNLKQSIYSKIRKEYFGVNNKKIRTNYDYIFKKTN